MSFSMTFNEIALKACAALALKMGLLHFLTVRSRLISGNMKSGRAASWAEDEAMHPIVVAMLKVGVGAIGPCLATTERWVGVVANAVENEPYFMALVLAYASAGVTLPTWAPTLVATYVAARYAHAVMYLFPVVPQPGRAVAFIIGNFSMLGLAASALF
ncbi:hypothetical protein M885DRAFT_575862 [Pelagophyceae sp. CCMP2097]|nr:hypothetical protein M885DRAFT_575862 [Pelagophyceae sp. CCMP2097]|mmetsp:Transcript_417/g.1411  ORF Transcript_417/g.1411 Transcript_417/m.1411 type:complete len:159 (-) Transcript_417:251-727(-)